MDILIGLVIGAAAGALAVWLALRSVYLTRIAAGDAERGLLRERVDDLQAAIGDDQQTASVLAPLSAALQRVEQQVGTLERERARQLGELGSQLTSMGRQTAQLQHETASLNGALRSTSARGTWGEVQLRRILEHSGMLPRCDFDEQVTARTVGGRSIRPDVVVHLPGAKTLVIDSKVPCDAYLAAQADDCTDADRDRLLAEHAAALGKHVAALSSKEYWSGFADSPQLVVCFVPADAILASALRADPALLDRALAAHVVPTSPSTLLALLSSVAHAWQQDSLAEGAKELLTLGQTLYQRLATLGKHTNDLGKALRRSVETYNSMVGTLESRVMVTARSMHQLGMASAAPPQLAPVEVAPRPLTAAELLGCLDEQVARSELDPRTGESPERQEQAG